MNFKKVLISELKPAAYNPRKNLSEKDPEYQRIKKSIETFGYVDPVIVNADYTVIGGHQRLKVLKGMGEASIDVVVVDLPKDQEKALNVALNKITGEWDMQQLSIVLSELKEADFDISITGFSDKELADIDKELFGEKVTLDTEPQISRAEELRKEWGTELGQLWQCGDHRVICGDCTDPAVVKRVMQGEKADMVFTDPPYGVNIIKGNRGRIGLSQEYNPIIGDDKPFDPRFLLELSDKQILFGGNYFAHLLPPTPCWLIWLKKDEESKSNNFADCEVLWTNFTTPMRVYPFVWRGNWYRSGNRKDEMDKMNHPTQKPVGLLTNIFGDFGKDVLVVLDPFLGSGTTMIACENLGRKCRGIEIDPGYLGVILQRYKDTFKKDPVLLEGD